MTRFEEHEEDLKVVFNMDIAYLQRLDKLLYSLDTAFLNWNLEKALIILKTIYREISPKLNSKEEIKIDKLLKEAYDHRREYYETGNSFHKKIASDFYKKLEELDVKLRKLMKTYGFIFMDGSDPRSAIINQGRR